MSTNFLCLQIVLAIRLQGVPGVLGIIDGFPFEEGNERIGKKWHSILFALL